MSKRLKTAIKFGLFWGIFMALFTLLFDLREKNVSEIVCSTSFWIRSLSYVVLGIFPVGYFSYKTDKDNQ